MNVAISPPVKESTIFTRASHKAMMAAIKKIMEEAGYKDLHPPSDPYDRAFVSKEFLATIGYKSAEREDRCGTIGPKLDRKDMDLLTIKCAIAMIPFAPCDISGEAELCQIRSELAQLLIRLGYINRLDLCVRIGTDHLPLFPSYALWKDLAQALSLSSEDIIEAREHARRWTPEQYEP